MGDVRHRIGRLTFHCVLAVDPMPMPRPKVTTRGKHPHAYMPKKAREYVDNCAVIMGAHWRQPPMEGPVAVYVTFVHKRPMRLGRRKDPPGRIWKDTRPDLDNLVKAILDSAQQSQAGVLADDGQVVLVEARDMYGAKGERGKIEIEIMPIVAGALEGE